MKDFHIIKKKHFLITKCYNLLTILNFHFYLLPYLQHQQTSKLMFYCMYYHLWWVLRTHLAPAFYRMLYNEKMQNLGEVKACHK